MTAIAAYSDEEVADSLAADPGVRAVQRWDFEGSPPASRVDLLVLPPAFPAERLPVLRGLTIGLVQSQAIGFEGVREHLPPGNLFANAASVHEPATAELAVALTLASQRDLPAYVRHAGHRRWEPRRSPGLWGKTVLLVGYGGVNRGVEQRLAPFGVDIVRVALRARGAPRVHAADDLMGLLPTADVVIVCVPLSASTRGLVDAAFLARVKDGALIVNVARGAVADTEAIVREAETGRLRFALDVVEPEPLPEPNALWALPNVLISPHVGSATDAMRPYLRELLRRQVQLIRGGEHPLNIVIRT
ncbi:NAD(P)-dependent oxidoreductase [Phytohabitans sp. ZYX-F-186]|uniref:NAD(P)-dependent oxidoreductase n=1 Tax=Phytohabitans maris TaxID=3071409 RepID=A0ABU0ZC49_9ACTN|nr:NAD(P)-dependent oxidoreductase [Phytohabitans sp. ZYX-F-186]MDQ7904646.1 NAD(P)-dependent oxidoreductase [Phytohabitans sp. ZYX-F-186]